MKRHVCTGCCHAFRTQGGLKRHQRRENGEPPRRMRTPKEWRQERAEGRQDRAREHMANPSRPAPVRAVRPAPAARTPLPVRAAPVRMPAPRIPVRAPRARLPRMRAGR